MVDEKRIERRADEALDKVKGKTNEIVGAARGDLGQEMKGKGQQVKGSVKGALNDLREEKDREKIR